MNLCIHDQLASQARLAPNAPAILAPGRLPLTYGRLYQHVGDAMHTLHALGVRRHDRVALVLPNGPDMAVACLAVAAAATCVPLNPDYSAAEFDRYLADAHVNTLVLQADTVSSVRAVAHARGLHLIELSALPDTEAGRMTLSGEPWSNTTYHAPAQPADDALVLQSSGTTSQPKMVPLTQHTICTWAINVGRALELDAQDRCLNVMPLFHGHGLVITTLASLLAGASIVCTPGFYAAQFFTWIEMFRPTWYSASPTLHQAILARAARHRDIMARCSLRFIRSSSATLAVETLEALERIFQAPVIEGYGMTEAHVQATCNPLPPRRHKPGSVGVAAGLDVAIMDAANVLLPAGQVGEIVVRGIRPEAGGGEVLTADENPITSTWYRTGDLGYLDADSYLWVTGRIKEMINRGGEKINPREVEMVLMRHPAVAQAVAFPIPDSRLGEEVAAAVVLQPDAVTSERNLRVFAATYLAPFKVPRQLCIVDTIPKNALGKLQRTRLAEQLELAASDWRQPEAPPDVGASLIGLEERLARIWTQTLGLDAVGRHDDFFSLGGDSLVATQLLSRVRDILQVEVSFLSFFDAPTVFGMARSIDTTRQAERKRSTPLLIPVSREGVVPTSVAQEHLWRLDQILPRTPLFNKLYTARLSGALNVTALEQSFHEMIRRHEVLRTTFGLVDPTAKQPIQIIAPALQVPLQLDDLRGLAPSERDGAARQLVREAALMPFDLERGPLLRLLLLRLDDQACDLIVVLHSMVSDGWSIGVLAHELSALYNAFAMGKPSPLSALPIQYADFACWQRQWLRSPMRDTQLAYWTQRLRDLPPQRALPTDRPRPATLSFSTARQSIELPKALSEALIQLGRQERSTLFMTLAAAFSLLLHTYTAEDDLVMATPIATRSQPALAGLIGLFTNTVALRFHLGGNPSFRDVLQQVRESTLAAQAHQELPFEVLLQALKCEPGMARASGCQVMFIVQEEPRYPLSFSTLAPSVLEFDQRFELDLTATSFDLIVMIHSGPHGLYGSCLYKTHLFDTSSIDRIRIRFRYVLEQICTYPDQSLATIKSLLL